MTPAEVAVSGGWPLLHIHIRGDLDLLSVPRVEERLADALGASPRELVVDLSSLDFMDSTGVAMLFRLAVDSAPRRRELTVIAPPASQVRRVLDLVGFAEAAALADAPPA